LKNNGYLDYSLLLAVEVRSGHLRDLSTNITTLLPTYEQDHNETVIVPNRESITDNILSSVETSKFTQAEARHKFKSKCGRYIYHLSVIDYLQEWNSTKKLE
jgi:hypothetical protein